MARLIAPYKDELWPIYFEIFTTAKKGSRVDFFNEQLIKVLWARFVDAKKLEIEKRFKTPEKSIQTCHRYSKLS